MKTQPKPRSSVPGSSAISGHGGDHGNGAMEGAKNLRRVTVGHHPKLTLATYNERTLRLDSHLAQLEVELGKIKWHILGLCEVCKGEDTITLESGHLMYFHERDQQFQGGVGFLVNKTLADNVVENSSVTNRVAYLIIKLYTERYSLKMVQVYAPCTRVVYG
jgi:hypothetical protein